ncbi:MAG: alpha/beta hydrolase [Lachnospiraceae bacterium]|nr:alpha/beta hydrolase [Lachnospiraceae bacterium]MBQ6639293.1 alpha/beta hydrolase [Lachnospiraceae bacterium]
MKKPLKIILRIVLIFVLANVVLALPIASFAEVLVLKSKGDRARTTEENMRAFVKEEAGIDTGEFEQNYSMERFDIPSTATKGYSIPVFVLHTNEEKRGLVVMAHGMNSSHIGIYPEAEAFLNAGLDVWALDERKFGESTWDYISYGYYEGEDVEDVLSYALTADPGAELVGIWGQSMGGAACENAMDTEVFKENADFAILDCPMGSMEELTGAPKIQNRLANKINKLVSGYSFDAQNPYAQMDDLSKDVLVIVAEEESVIPESSISRIKQVLKEEASSYTEYLGDDSKHANVWNSHPAEYENTIRSFLDGVQAD